MKTITNLPPVIPLDLYQGDTLLLHLPLDFEGQPLSDEQKAAFEAASYQMQFRHRARDPVPLGTVIFEGMAETVDPDTGISGWGPIFKVEPGLSAKLPPFCLADVQMLSRDPYGPSVQTLASFECTVEREVTR